MRGIQGPLAMAVIAAAALAVTGCGNNDKAEAAATGASRPSATPAAASQALPGQEAVPCGTGPNGLAVVTLTAKGTDFCATAIQVATTYTQERTKKADGDLAIEVADMRWVCGERQGDPNPFQECASQNESADKVRLLS
ncbi:hypothetical protein OHB26_21240 [Nocardia sp. NBC_01503]|uniref:hypothetical protein n=1 Tax=Nocardia sp. NBC_01503 TaxID=2975997 RepID=UPI002E7B6FE6|nr:hypothetical protein [Nocardia sp. NBC_01503]WTL29518.1 hypothetical protein OHB26_21240 [Nocardia sp. NBC_01503]